MRDDLATWTKLVATVRGRDARTIVLECNDTHERVVLADSTGDVELLLELLCDGRRSRDEVVVEMTSKRDGATPAAILDALDALAELGLLLDECTISTPPTEVGTFVR
jgi:hypothetical protein